MDEKFQKFIAGLDLDPGASLDLIEETQVALGIILPAEYLEFMKESNGAEGPIGSYAYLQLWPIEELVPLNKASRVHEFAPGLLLFASDGGGTAYAFDTRFEDFRIVDVPFIPLSLEEARECGHSFVEFLNYLYESQ